MPSHHHPSHASAPYPPSYPPQSSHPGYHPSSRHVSNGPPPPGIGGPGVPLGGPPEGPPVPHPMSNGHSQHTPHHQPPPAPVSAAARAGKEKQEGVLAQLANANENTWMLIGAVAEQMQDQDRAMAAFENALRHNPNSILGLNAVASIARSRDNFDKAIEYFQRILNIKQDNGEVWGSMGHCLLMKDDLPKAYTAYQQALYHLPNPKEPKLWYGIGILYDRYGSFEHAEEAFSSVLKMDPNFEKANEIYFRLGIIYKHQRKYQSSLECFKYILQDPPRPLTSWDIWFQLGHVYEQDRDYENARDAYNRVLAHQPDHAKVLQQLGWLHHQPGAPFMDQDKAVSYLTKSLETDGSDAQSWYLLGRAFMAGSRFNKAYEAYQQAVYRDGRNPTFWCSIGVLYFQINQYRDALDAYSRAIRLNPYISEVWYNLGSLYESCNNQITDAIDAYTRAADLDPSNATIQQRLQILQTANANNAPLPEPPKPVDVHPSQYTAQPQGPYPPGGSPGSSPRPVQMAPPGLDMADGQNGRALPPPPSSGDLGRGHSPGPFRGGAAPPPLQRVDESRGTMSRHAPLAPMETDAHRAPRDHRDPRDPRDPRDLRDPRDSRDPRDPRDHRDPRDPRDPRDTRDIRDSRDPRDHRGMDVFPGPPRYDPTSDVPRRHGSPGSPRRREAYPPYPPYYGRDRERDEWERRNSRGGPGPSPRLHERAVAPPGRQPSPRHPEHGYGYPPDPRAGYPHDRREPTPSSGPGPRLPSGSFEDPRAPSPAPSSVVSVGGRKRRDEEPRSAKKEKPVSKKNSGDKKSLKVTLRPGAGPGGPSPRASASPTKDPAREAASSLPSRTVDEDYDEGAADALMFLHSATSPPGSMAGNKRPASPSSPPNTKKARPEAVNRLSAAGPLGNGRNGSASPAKRQVIEVLNTPSISSPVPRPSSGFGFSSSKRDVEIKGEVFTENKADDASRGLPSAPPAEVAHDSAQSTSEKEEYATPLTNRSTDIADTAEAQGGDAAPATESDHGPVQTDTSGPDPASPVRPVVSDVKEDLSARDTVSDVIMGDADAAPSAERAVPDESAGVIPEEKKDEGGVKENGSEVSKGGNDKEGEKTTSDQSVTADDEAGAERQNEKEGEVKETES